MGFYYGGKPASETSLMAGERETGGTDRPDCGRADCDSHTEAILLHFTVQPAELQMPADWIGLKINSGPEPLWRPDTPSLQFEEILVNYWRESIGVTLRYNDAS